MILILIIEVTIRKVTDRCFN